MLASPRGASAPSADQGDGVRRPGAPRHISAALSLLAADEPLGSGEGLSAHYLDLIATEDRPCSRSRRVAHGGELPVWLRGAHGECAPTPAGSLGRASADAAALAEAARRRRARRRRAAAEASEEEAAGKQQDESEEEDENTAITKVVARQLIAIAGDIFTSDVARQILATRVFEQAKQVCVNPFQAIEHLHAELLKAGHPPDKVAEAMAVMHKEMILLVQADVGAWGAEEASQLKNLAMLNDGVHNSRYLIGKFADSISTTFYKSACRQIESNPAMDNIRSLEDGVLDRLDLEGAALSAVMVAMETAHRSNFDTRPMQEHRRAESELEDSTVACQSLYDKRRELRAACAETLSQQYERTCSDMIKTREQTRHYRNEIAQRKLDRKDNEEAYRKAQQEAYQLEEKLHDVRAKAKNSVLQKMEERKKLIDQANDVGAEVESKKRLLDMYALQTRELARRLEEDLVGVIAAEYLGQREKEAKEARAKRVEQENRLREIDRKLAKNRNRLDHYKAEIESLEQQAAAEKRLLTVTVELNALKTKIENMKSAIDISKRKAARDADRLTQCGQSGWGKKLKRKEGAEGAEDDGEEDELDEEEDESEEEMMVSHKSTGRAARVGPKPVEDTGASMRSKFVTPRRHVALFHSASLRSRRRASQLQRLASGHSKASVASSMPATRLQRSASADAGCPFQSAVVECDAAWDPRGILTNSAPNVAVWRGCIVRSSSMHDDSLSGRVTTEALARMGRRPSITPAGARARALLAGPEPHRDSGRPRGRAQAPVHDWATLERRWAALWLDLCRALRSAGDTGPQLKALDGGLRMWASGVRDSMLAIFQDSARGLRLLQRLEGVIAGPAAEAAMLGDRAASLLQVARLEPGVADHCRAEVGIFGDMLDDARSMVQEGARSLHERLQIAAGVVAAVLDIQQETRSLYESMCRYAAALQCSSFETRMLETVQMPQWQTVAWHQKEACIGLASLVRAADALGRRARALQADGGPIATLAGRWVCTPVLFEAPEELAQAAAHMFQSVLRATPVARPKSVAGDGWDRDSVEAEEEGEEDEEGSGTPTLDGGPSRRSAFSAAQSRASSRSRCGSAGHEPPTVKEPVVANITGWNRLPGFGAPDPPHSPKRLVCRPTQPRGEEFGRELTEPPEDAAPRRGRRGRSRRHQLPAAGSFLRQNAVGDTLDSSSDHADSRILEQYGSALSIGSEESDHWDTVDRQPTERAFPDWSPRSGSRRPPSGESSSARGRDVTRSRSMEFSGQPGNDLRVLSFGRAPSRGPTASPRPRSPHGSKEVPVSATVSDADDLVVARVPSSPSRDRTPRNAAPAASSTGKNTARRRHANGQTAPRGRLNQQGSGLTRHAPTPRFELDDLNIDDFNDDTAGFFRALSAGMEKCMSEGNGGDRKGSPVATFEFEVQGSQSRSQSMGTDTPERSRMDEYSRSQSLMSGGDGPEVLHFNSTLPPLSWSRATTPHELREGGGGFSRQTSAADALSRGRQVAPLGMPTGQKRCAALLEPLLLQWEAQGPEHIRVGTPAEERPRMCSAPPAPLRQQLEFRREQFRQAEAARDAAAAEAPLELHGTSSAAAKKLRARLAAMRLSSFQGQAIGAASFLTSPPLARPGSDMRFAGSQTQPSNGRVSDSRRPGGSRPPTPNSPTSPASLASMARRGGSPGGSSPTRGRVSPRDTAEDGGSPLPVSRVVVRSGQGAVIADDGARRRSPQPRYVRLDVSPRTIGGQPQAHSRGQGSDAMAMLANMAGSAPTPLWLRGVVDRAAHLAEASRATTPHVPDREGEEEGEGEEDDEVLRALDDEVRSLNQHRQRIASHCPSLLLSQRTASRGEARASDDEAQALTSQPPRMASNGPSGPHSQRMVSHGSAALQPQRTASHGSSALQQLRMASHGSSGLPASFLGPGEVPVPSFPPPPTMEGVRSGTPSVLGRPTSAGIATVPVDDAAPVLPPRPHTVAEVSLRQPSALAARPPPAVHRGRVHLESRGNSKATPPQSRSQSPEQPGGPRRLRMRTPRTSIEDQGDVLPQLCRLVAQGSGAARMAAQAHWSSGGRDFVREPSSQSTDGTGVCWPTAGRPLSSPNPTPMPTAPPSRATTPAPRPIPARPGSVASIVLTGPLAAAEQRQSGDSYAIPALRPAPKPRPTAAEVAETLGFVKPAPSAGAPARRKPPPRRAAAEATAAPSGLPASAHVLARGFAEQTIKAAPPGLRKYIPMRGAPTPSVRLQR